MTGRKADAAAITGMPRNSCSTCGRIGPSTKAPLLSVGSGPSLIVVWCEICRRYFCGRCVLCTAAESDDEACFTWMCPLCGERVGRESEPSWLIDGPLDEASIHGHIVDGIGDYGTVDWEAFESYLSASGAVRPVRLRHLDELIASDDPTALSRVEAEEYEYSLRGDRIGLAHCAAARAMILMESRPEGALEALQIAEACWLDIGNRWRLSQTLFTRYQIRKGLGRRDAEKAADLEELASIASGVHESIASFCEDEATRICAGRRDYAGFVERALQREDSIASLEGMLESSTSKAVFNVDSKPVLRWTVPDWEPPSLLHTELTAEDARRGSLVANLLLAALDETGEFHLPLQEAAIRLWSKALGRRTPALAWCLNELGRSLIQRRRFHEAAHLHRQAAAIAVRFARADPMTPGKYLNNLGMCLALVGQDDAALEALDRALALCPALREPHYWRGKIYGSRGDAENRPRERDAWRRYLEAGASGARRSEAELRLAELST
jgi:tetratricopeptide (TPR) repeat protein